MGRQQGHRFPVGVPRPRFFCSMIPSGSKHSLHGTIGLLFSLKTMLAEWLRFALKERKGLSGLSGPACSVPRDLSGMVRREDGGQKPDIGVEVVSILRSTFPTLTAFRRSDVPRVLTGIGLAIQPNSCICLASSDSQVCSGFPQ